MQGDPAAYHLMLWIMNLGNSGSIAWWALPILSIYMLLRFLNWAWRSSRGERMDDLDADLQTATNDLRNKYRQTRGGYGPDLPSPGRYRRQR